jgi:hypothetical protein
MRLRQAAIKTTGGAYCWAEGDELAGARGVLGELHPSEYRYPGRLTPARERSSPEIGLGLPIGRHDNEGEFCGQKNSALR